MNIDDIIPSDRELDNKVRHALDGRPQRHKVWAMLGSEGTPYRAEPILITVRIVADKETGLAWHPISGRTIGEDSREVDAETLRGDRIWWGPWLRRFAAARLRVERQQLREKPVEHGLADEVERVMASLEAHERRVLEQRFGGADGDRQLRIVAEFPAPRGYGGT